MTKRIAFCADGTWDSSTNNSNVYKLYKALSVGAQQITLYDDGVGADGNPIEKLLGGAIGAGLFQKIKDGYTKIAHVYEQEDQIFLFGFSRGAYTARSLAGMIAICGLPTKNFDDNLVNAAFQAYRNRDQRTVILNGLQATYGMFDTKITMVGVWDTVGALGIPAIVGGVDPAVFGFLDTGLHPDVLNAYHALAINERRREFPATLWTSQPAPGQTVEQVWFAGVHCDVGGGYPAAGLSDITLSWMTKKANALGLNFVPEMWAQYGGIADPQQALDEIHESWTPLWGLPNPRPIARDATLGNSVVIRCQRDGSYRPGNLSLAGGVPAATHQIVPVVAEPSLQTAVGAVARQI